MLAGARRLDGRIERQQVGLARNLLDDRDLVGDLLHRGYCFEHRLAALLCVLGALVGDLVGLLRVVGVLLDVRDHLFHRRRSLFGRRRLRAGALGYLDRGRGDGLAGSRYLTGNRTDIGNRLGQPVHHRSESLHQLVLRRALPDGHRKVAVGNLFGGRRDVVHGHDERIQVVLDQVEVAMVGIGDLRRDVPLRNLLHIPGGEVQRRDDRVENGVHSAHDIGIRSLHYIRVPALGELPFLCGTGNVHQHLFHNLKHLCDLIDRLLHLFVIALVGLGNQLVDLAR